ncbi:MULTISPECIES: hypothetical protein [unclassified Algibacter]|uniref:hypothetical protein n=1 Tax=unclassified Algibacter TaxID=2615009 RepID=UPI00131D1CC3|nr:MULTISPECIES: hypothetical protein [unclassified Algibacter]MCL5130073.1 hypothetical protein [Algibacter sp. L4_22]
MKYFKKNLTFSFVIFTLVLLSGCSSDDNNESAVEGVIPGEELSIISFDILSKDHSFSVIKSNTQPVDSLVICLFPSSIDYSNLIPKIKFKGTSIEYRINNDSFNAYPLSIGDNIDFSYPNTVDFRITNSDDSESRIYRIIIDTEQPILFNNPEIIIPDSQVNANYHGLEIDTWLNVGNYPIRLTLRTTEYIDIITPETGISNIFSTTLTNDSDFVKPNEEGNINVFESNITAVIGAYKATALFNLYFNENLGYIVYDDITNDYVKNIGYKQAELKLKGNLID